MQIKVNFVFECIEKQTVGEFVKNSLAIQFDRSEFSEQKILQYSNLTYEMYKLQYSNLTYEKYVQILDGFETITQ